MDGNLAFPNSYGEYSVDGKIIDKNATKTIPIFELSSALTGIRANEGHVYDDIESDIIIDIANRSNYDYDTLADILKTITFNAMKSHFNSDDRINAFVNAITNFANALTGNDMPSSLTMTPLNAYRVMLETIYNFGYEIEADMNIAIIKLSSVYHSARSILEFVNFISTGKPVTDQYAELDELVLNELTDERYYHHNVNNHIYSYAAGTYVDFNLDTYALMFAGNNPVEGTYVRFEDHNVKFIVGSTDDWNGTHPSELSSITEANVYLMVAKTLVYNKIKGTDYGLNEYLCKIGLLKEEDLKYTYGVVLELGGIKEGSSNCNNIDFATKLNAIEGELVELPDKSTVPVSAYDNTAFNELNGEGVYKMAVDGKQYSFKDGQTHAGILGLSFNLIDGGSSTVYPGAIYGYAEQFESMRNSKKCGNDAVYSAWLKYINFVPVTIS